MKTDIPPLQPSLWRTCRVLANRPRLTILAELLRKPGQSVTNIAARLGLSVPVASQYLRQLNARGLLAPSRQGSQVFYRVTADRTVPHAGVLLSELRKLLPGNDDAITFIYKHMTAFTHPRRIQLISVLGRGSMDAGAIRRATGISIRAVHRHLNKLQSRGYVVSTVEGFSLARATSSLAVVLLEEARGR